MTGCAENSTLPGSATGEDFLSLAPLRAGFLRSNGCRGAWLGFQCCGENQRSWTGARPRPEVEGGLWKLGWVACLQGRVGGKLPVIKATARLLVPRWKKPVPLIHVRCKLQMNKKILFLACKAVLKEYLHSPPPRKQGLREGERKKARVASHKAAAADPESTNVRSVPGELKAYPDTSPSRAQRHPLGILIHL
jgi:hypothetical protein